MNNDKLHEYINAIETELRRKTGECIAYEGAEYNVHDRSARIELIRRLTEDYSAYNDKYPDGALLERLADAVLNEEISYKHCDKSTRTDYSFLSVRQVQKRTSREVPLSAVSGDVSTIELTVFRYESVDERLRREIDTEYKRYTEINSLMPVTVRKATAEELARIAPTPRIKKQILTPTTKSNSKRNGKHIKWSYLVRSRDDFTCIRCHDDNSQVHAHHIESYANNPKLRYDVNNGITLCSTCHTEFHEIYGYGNNTHEQFDEWMGGDYYEL